jgi:Sec-independent protein secretion pathway component TatC
MNRTTLLLIRVGLPVVWALTPMALAAIGILDYQRLKFLRRYIIAANLIIAAVVTTPEVLTQVIAAVAMQACYEIAVLVSYLRDRQKSKREVL